MADYLKSTKKAYAVLFILAGIMVMVFVSLSCMPENYPVVLQPLAIGSSHNEADTLLYIAYKKGFFISNGLEVTIKSYTSGAAAVNGMLNDEVDIATGSEYVIVQNVFKRQVVNTIGVISKTYSVRLVGRIDLGIRSISDLEGKRIGVPLGTLGQFYLSRFLELKGMIDKPMTMVNIDVSQSVDVLVNGDVDAVQTWEPYASRIKEKLGDDAMVWSSQNEQPQYKNVIVTDVWLSQYPDVMERVLKALAEAESFTTLHSDEAKTIIQEWLGYDDEYMALAWQTNEFPLFLNQALLLAMEDEARWMIINKLTTEEQIPDFRGYIYVDGLKAVKPEAVNIR